MKKENLCIFVGYTSFYVDFYGTEIAIIKLATELSKLYNIYIVTLSEDISHEFDNGIIYVNYKNLKVDIDILIISRYINYFIYCCFKPCKKIYLWVHDVTLIAYYENYIFENYGKEYLHNFINRIDKIIVLSDWHKNFFQQYYNIPENKLLIIGNGISTIDFLPISLNIKQKNRFIWTSCLTRGIERCISIIQIIHKELPDTELHIFRDYNLKKEYVESLKDLNYIYFYGKVDNLRIIEEFKKSDFWFYPTIFSETYCISALEAQMAGCVSISTNVASLNTTVGDHGILLSNDLSNEEIALEVIKIMKDDELKNNTRVKGIIWAYNQDWKNISKKWINLLKYKKYFFF